MKLFRFILKQQVAVLVFLFQIFPIKHTVSQEFYHSVNVGYNLSYNCGFTIDGKYLIYPDFNELHFFDIANKKEIKKIQIGKADINGFFLSKKEKWLVIGNDSNYVMLYDYKSMKLKYKFYRGVDSDANFNCLTISNDENRLLYKDAKSVKIIDLKTFKKTDSIAVPDVLTLCFHPLGNIVALSDYNNIIVYDCLKKGIIDTLFHTKQYHEANRVQFNRSGNKLISIGFQGGNGISIRDFKTGKLLVNYYPAGHAGDYNGFAINPTETIISSLNSTNDFNINEFNEDGSENLQSPFELQFHSFTTGKEIKKIPLLYKTHLNKHAEFNFFLFSKDGKYLAVSGMNGIMLWKMI